MPRYQDTFYVNEKGQLIRKFEDNNVRFIRRGLQANETIVFLENVKHLERAKRAVEKWEKESGKTYRDKPTWLFE